MLNLILFLFRAGGENEWINWKLRRYIDNGWHAGTNRANALESRSDRQAEMMDWSQVVIH